MLHSIQAPLPDLVGYHREGVTKHAGTDVLALDDRLHTVGAEINRCEHPQEEMPHRDLSGRIQFAGVVTEVTPSCGDLHFSSNSSGCVVGTASTRALPRSRMTAAVA